MHTRATNISNVILRGNIATCQKKHTRTHKKNPHPTQTEVYILSTYI